MEIVAEYDSDSDNVIDAAELKSANIGMREKCVARMKEFAEKRGLDRERPYDIGDRKKRLSRSINSRFSPHHKF